MKILTVVGNLGVGGTQRVAQNLSLGLSALGADVGILAYLGGGPREDACRAGGLRIFTPKDANYTHEIDATSAAESASEAVIEAARQWQPDIIHIHRTGYTNPYETRILQHLRTNGAKIVETNVFARFDWGEGGNLIDAHCLLSKWCAFKWNAWGGTAALRKRSFILPNAVDVNSIIPISHHHRRMMREELGIPSERFIFGRVGQPVIAKWSPAIYDVFQMTLQKHDIGLLLIGAPEEIVEKARDLPDDARSRIVNVPVTTSDEHLSALIGMMDGFLHISAIGESFGMVLCEAMMSGVPVVTLSTPLKDNSQLEVVGHEKGGLIALTMDAVPDAMSRLINDKTVRNAVREGGAQWVASRFGIDVVSQKAMEIYQSLLSDTPLKDDSDAPPDREWLYNMLSNGMGEGPNARTNLIFNLLHNPHIYRTYLATAKFWKK
jgi:glycosyltransferase involved in cell wall biosynthesis